MSIKSDIAEVRDLWSNATVLTRVVLILSLLLTISSVTSIADVVFEWRGFIRTAMDFYRLVIRDPIANLLSFIRIPADWADFIIGSAIYTGVFLRSNRGDALRGPFLSLKFLLGFVAALVGSVLIHSLTSDYQPFVLLTFFLFLVGWAIDFSRRERISYYMYLSVVYLVLFVLAAVNEGLTRPGGVP